MPVHGSGFRAFGGRSFGQAQEDALFRQPPIVSRAPAFDPAPVPDFLGRLLTGGATVAAAVINARATRDATKRLVQSGVPAAQRNVLLASSFGPGAARVTSPFGPLGFDRPPAVRVQADGDMGALERLGRLALPETLERGFLGPTEEQELRDLAACGIVMPVAATRGGTFRFAKQLTVRDPRRANSFVVYKNMGKPILFEGSVKECRTVAKVARLAAVAGGFEIKRKGPARRRRR